MNHPLIENGLKPTLLGHSNRVFYSSKPATKKPKNNRRRWKSKYLKQANKESVIPFEAKTQLGQQSKPKPPPRAQNKSQATSAQRLATSI